MIRIISIESLPYSAKILFDDGTSLNIRKKDIKSFELSVNCRVDREALESSLFKAQIDEGYEASLNMLDRSAKTEQEIRKKLLINGYLIAVAEAVCEKLKKARLIDDAYIAQRLTSSMVANGKGQYAIMRKLRAKGVSEEDTEAAIRNLNDEEQKNTATEQAKKLLRKYEALPEREQKARLSQALARRGFSWDTIEYTVNGLFE